MIDCKQRFAGPCLQRSAATDPGRAWPYAVMRGTAQDPAPGPSATRVAGPRQDFAVTLSDGRRVVGRALDGDWSVYVYASDGDGRLLGYGTGRTRPLALEKAGLSGADAGEVLGRTGI